MESTYWDGPSEDHGTEYCRDCGGVVACERPRYDHVDWCVCEPREARQAGRDD